MLSAQVQEIFANLRRAEKKSSQTESLDAILDQKGYANLVSSLLQVTIFKYLRTASCSQLFMLFSLSSQYCKELGISMPTAYLALTYINIVLPKLNLIDEKKLLMVSLCCTCLATKYNQPWKVRCVYSPQMLCAHGHQSFKPQEIIDLELEIFMILDQNFLYTTPYDYIYPFFQTFPWLSKVKEGLSQIIGFAITFPQLSKERPQTIFYASFLALVEIKDCPLTAIQKKVVTSQLVDPERVQIIRKSIVSAYNLIANSDDSTANESEIQIESE